jgi:hypothetical protein
MLNTQQANRVRKLRNHGYNAREIVSLTKLMPADVRRVIYEDTRGNWELKEAAGELLGDMPPGFVGGAEKWRALVVANFGE